MKELKRISIRKKFGLFSLVLLLIAIILFPRIYNSFQQPESFSITFEELDKEVSDLQQKRVFSQQKSQRKKRRYVPPSAKFNPNEYTVTDWMLLGLSEKQANVILNFSQRGIYSNEQLKQIFVINDELYELIKDSTIYPKKQKELFEKFEYNKAINTTLKIELNSAEETELTKLSGIGAYYAKKIVDYRSKLGGYVSKDQLLELWKFDEEKLNKIRNNIDVDLSKVKKININTCSAEQLQSHPYIDWNVANSIVKMRAKYEKYSNFEQLLRSDLISSELLEKIKPYLSLEN